jgi:26S proteasome regulatory subunit N1
MAKDGERSAAADKGKGKVDDVRELNGQKKDAKDDKSSKVGKKDDKDDELPEGKLAARFADCGITGFFCLVLIAL